MVFFVAFSPQRGWHSSPHRLPLPVLCVLSASQGGTSRSPPGAGLQHRPPQPTGLVEGWLPTAWAPGEHTLSSSLISSVWANASAAPGECAPLPRSRRDKGSLRRYLESSRSFEAAVGVQFWLYQAPKECAWSASPPGEHSKLCGCQENACSSFLRWEGRPEEVQQLESTVHTRSFQDVAAFLPTL